ncbi:MAG: hypothetical protein CM15mP95_0970 [Alphaproteobacteria bacterium]|nr:MAG: hypothetical protein CM15mP95_0970 [Alphaproteobacteria bacterium]
MRKSHALLDLTSKKGLKFMSEILSMKSLRAAVANCSIDTVIAGLSRYAGTSMGKRFHAKFFVDNAWKRHIAVITNCH